MPFRNVLYYIAPLENVQFIMECGILCHKTPNNDEDPHRKDILKGILCAEALIPERVCYSYVRQLTRWTNPLKQSCLK